MREIFFRGKRVDNGEWVEGVPHSFGDGYFIVNVELQNRYGCYIAIAKKIIPGTVGQWTGMIDKNGKKIFEGDVVQTIDYFHKGDVQFSHGVFGIEWDLDKKNKAMVGSWGQEHNLRKMDDGFYIEIEVIRTICIRQNSPPVFLTRIGIKI